MNGRMEIKALERKIFDLTDSVPPEGENLSLLSESHWCLKIIGLTLFQGHKRVCLEMDGEEVVMNEVPSSVGISGSEGENSSDKTLVL
ncbi:hypothetical protein QL285_032996 [Trifolium repens]|nr:hypothetical protein QL285_032996 [Trifolium repens]